MFSPERHRLQPDFDRVERVTDDEGEEAAGGAGNDVGVRVQPQEVHAGLGRRRNRGRRRKHLDISLNVHHFTRSVADGGETHSLSHDFLVFIFAFVL